MIEVQRCIEWQKTIRHGDTWAEWPSKWNLTVDWDSKRYFYYADLDLHGKEAYEDWIDAVFWRSKDNYNPAETCPPYDITWRLR